MKRSPLKCGGVLIYALFVATCLLAPAIAEDTPGITTDRSEINFGAHDIGSVASATLVVRNNSTASANVMIVVSGDNSNDFSWDSRCLSNVLANSNCEVSVFFRPVAITKTEDKLAQLVLSNGTSTTPPIPLRGAAFQNLGLSLYDVSFNEQLIDTVSTAHIVIVTNYSDVEINGLTIAVTGDFTETHTKCEKITPGGSCPISLSFAPKAVGDANGSLTITADQPARGKLPRVVVLHGNASMHCNTVDVSGLSWVWSVLLVVSVGGMYFAGLVLVRWHMIAKPTRAQLVAEVSVVRARLKSAASSLPASAPTAGRTERMDRINALLDLAVYPFKNKNFPVEKGDRTDLLYQVKC